MCTPRPRCTPLHSRHMNTPYDTDAHCGFRVLQSTHTCGDACHASRPVSASAPLQRAALALQPAPPAAQHAPCYPSCSATRAAPAQPVRRPWRSPGSKTLLSGEPPSPQMLCVCRRRRWCAHAQPRPRTATAAGEAPSALRCDWRRVTRARAHAANVGNTAGVVEKTRRERARGATRGRPRPPLPTTEGGPCTTTCMHSPRHDPCCCPPPPAPRLFGAAWRDGGSAAHRVRAPDALSQGRVRAWRGARVCLDNSAA
jgi:hypothetical protein